MSSPFFQFAQAFLLRILLKLLSVSVTVSKSENRKSTHCWAKGRTQTGCGRKPTCDCCSNIRLLQRSQQVHSNNSMSLPYSEFSPVWLYVKIGKDNLCVGVLWGFWIKSFEFLFFHIIFIFQKSRWGDSQAGWKRCYWLIRMRNSQP